MSVLGKLALTTATSKSGRKVLGGVILVILSPLILAVVLIASAGSEGSNHNMEIINVLYLGQALPSDMNYELKNHLTWIQDSFKEIDRQVDEIKVNEGSLDRLQIKTFFLVYHIEDKQSKKETSYYKDFINCFLEGEKAIGDEKNIRDKLEKFMKKPLTKEQMENYKTILAHVRQLLNSSVGGSRNTAIDPFVEASLPTPYVGGQFVEPVKGWRNKVTSEYGPRTDPISFQPSFHNGIDIADGAGTPIMSVADGTVVIVDHSNEGYGNKVVVDHGGGILTLYAHGLSIPCKVGDKVKKGDIVLLMGTTGYSTGNHLHFEVYNKGPRENPRIKLPQ